VAHFYATLRGTRGKTSRRGTKASGMQATVASWQGAPSVRLWHDGGTETDMAEVSLIPWYGAGDTIPLYAGPVSGPTLRALRAGGRCGSCNASPRRCRCVRAES